jgi:hypothetical protein
MPCETFTAHSLPERVSMESLWLEVDLKSLDNMACRGKSQNIHNLN